MTLYLLPSAASTYRPPFIEYFDCVRIDQAPVAEKDDIDVFTKVNGTSKRWNYKGATTVRGLNIHLLLAEDGSIEGIEMVPKSTSPNSVPVKPPFPIVLKLADLKSGIQFGALNTTMHTIEVNKNFDPKSGGELKMGILSEVSYPGLFRDWLGKDPNKTDIEWDQDLLSALEKNPAQMGGLSKSLKAHYNSDRNPDLWREFDFKVVRQDGKWVLLDDQGQPVNTLFAEMKFKKIPLLKTPVFQGLTQIKSVLANQMIDPTMQCPLVAPEQIWDRQGGQQSLQTSPTSGQLDCNRE